MDRHSRICGRTVPAVIAAFLLAASSSALGASSPATSFSGQATVLRATVLGTTIILADTGPLPAEGGARQATLLTANVPGLLSARVLDATVVGDGDRAHARASAADLELTVAGTTIQAELLASEATARCEDGAPTVSGSSQIAGLGVNGQSIAVTGQPNQIVTVAGATLIINEQTSAGAGDITVNALRVSLPGIATVIVSSAHADVTCGAPPPPPPPPPCQTPPRDFFTGGGWITGTPSGARANFGVAGGFRNGSFWGHLTYDDHGAGGPKVKATSVDSYEFVNENSRRITGRAKVNGQSGHRYDVTVADNGEPGRADSFSLSLSSGYAASGTLDGGNIQLHKPNHCQ